MQDGNSNRLIELAQTLRLLYIPQAVGGHKILRIAENENGSAVVCRGKRGQIGHAAGKIHGNNVKNAVQERESAHWHRSPAPAEAADGMRRQAGRHRSALP